MEVSIDSGRHDYQLEHMSLSGITERFGEPGLRRRFSMEIAAFSIEDQKLCMQALDDVTTLFADDTYKDLPYTSHLLRTPIRLMRDYEVTDPEHVISMVLHDGPEDHPIDLVKLADVDPPAHLTDQERALWALRERYTPRVASLVASVTNVPNPPDLTVEEKRLRYKENVEIKIARSVETFLLKLSDFTDNAVGLLWTDAPERLPHFAQKYHPLFDVFLAQLDEYEAQGKLSEMQVMNARRQLTVGKIRCEKVLGDHDLFPLQEV